MGAFIAALSWKFLTLKFLSLIPLKCDLRPKILLQIHDELIFEVPEKEVKTITKIIQDEMTSVTESDLHSFSTPLTVDVNSGDNWGLLR